MGILKSFKAIIILLKVLFEVLKESISVIRQEYHYRKEFEKVLKKQKRGG